MLNTTSMTTNDNAITTRTIRPHSTLTNTRSSRYCPSPDEGGEPSERIRGSHAVHIPAHACCICSSVPGRPPDQEPSNDTGINVSVTPTPSSYHLVVHARKRVLRPYDRLRRARAWGSPISREQAEHARSRAQQDHDFVATIRAPTLLTLQWGGASCAELQSTVSGHMRHAATAALPSTHGHGRGERRRPGMARRRPYMTEGAPIVRSRHMHHLAISEPPVL